MTITLMRHGQPRPTGNGRRRHRESKKTTPGHFAAH
jgi:hypothetical protein